MCCFGKSSLCRILEFLEFGDIQTIAHQLYTFFKRPFALTMACKHIIITKPI